MMEYTTVNGKTYTLKMKDGDHFYRWYGDGVLPKALAGGFTGSHLAQRAMEHYIETVDSKKEVREVDPLKKLKLISKRDELLEFAAEHSVEVPSEFTVPSQIKKYIRTQLGE